LILFLLYGIKKDFIKAPPDRPTTQTGRSQPPSGSMAHQTPIFPYIFMGRFSFSEELFLYVSVGDEKQPD
jgi:hypothetical protein